MLKSLVGPESTELQVKNQEKLSFKPVDLLDDLAFIYTNLSSIDYFCKSVVKDERSFKPEYLNQALRRLRLNKKFESISELEKFIQDIPKYTQ